VLTGINPNTNENIDHRGARPNRISFYLTVFKGGGVFEVKPFTANLLRDEEPVWFQLPWNNPPIDIALFELNTIIEGFAEIKDSIGYLQGGQMRVSLDE
jgi:hypothetical protein